MEPIEALAGALVSVSLTAVGAMTYVIRRRNNKQSDNGMLVRLVEQQGQIIVLAETNTRYLKEHIEQAERIITEMRQEWRDSHATSQNIATVLAVLAERLKK